MTPDFIGTLRAYASELESNPITEGESPLCITIEGSSNTPAESFWIQLHAGHINFLHLDSPDDDKTLGSILDAIDELGEVDIEPGSYVTFKIDGLGKENVDELITGLLTAYFGAGDEIRLTAEKL